MAASVWSGKRLLFVVAVASFLITLVFGWHLALVFGQFYGLGPMEGKLDRSKVSVNPLTNLVTLKNYSEVPRDNSFAALGESFGLLLVPAAAANEMNVRARETLDIYAMLIPYSVRMKTVDALGIDSTPSTTRQRGEATNSPREAERRACSEYIARSLRLEGVRVEQVTTTFGQEGLGVLGTVVNAGDRTLERVRVRIYFLDEAGRRIGEKEHSPVLVTSISAGDNTPLRPGYRRDFGYRVEQDAPSGWAKKVQVELSTIKFEEQE